jgi:NAD(P)-dependent dehydrogenase (short-subunit alcohol dehydrogenase family)
MAQHSRPPRQPTCGAAPTADSTTLLTALRGLLATASGNDDDPWTRVTLERACERPGGAMLQVPADVLQRDSAAARRECLQACLAEFAGRCAEPPAAVEFADGTRFRVSREASSLAAPLANKVALVTGAAGAIGAGICRGLLEKGCRVAATDLSQPGLDALVAELGPTAPGRLVGITVDVTDAASVAAGWQQAAWTWGGVDIVIVNAGIAMVAALTEMDIEGFRRLERVNIEGTLLTLAEAGRQLCAQGTGGDIVLVSTKNVFAPGAQFGAYSATKAASHQLARIASLELAPFGIRVNMVAPDAVFGEGSRRSGLWAEVGPSRMRARGLDEKGLEEYYRSRNLLKARVTAAHVANAVLFFVTRQTPTTGATLPVDGGLPDSTPR